MKPSLKHLLLAAYYYGTLPTRRWVRAARCAAGEAPVMVLFYHRVADSHPNAWTISTRQFARHIEWIERRFDMISLAEAQDRIRSGCNDWPAVSITFDDGYAENCQTALPLLIRKRIPVTYFVSLDHVMHGTAFPHDAVADGERGSGGNKERGRQGEGERGKQDGDPDTAAPLPISSCRPLSPNTIDQLRDLSRHGVEIAAHTRTHADLGRLADEGALVDEIVAARGELEDLVQQPVRYLAFPYGQPENISGAALQLAEQAGYAGVCSAYGGYNLPGGDPFHLRRIHGDPGMLRLKNWLTFDPRKLHLSRPLACEKPVIAGACREEAQGA